MATRHVVLPGDSVFDNAGAGRRSRGPSPPWRRRASPAPGAPRCSPG